MKKLLFVAAMIAGLTACAARDTTHYLPIEEVYQAALQDGTLDPKIKMYFGRSVGGKVVETATTNKKTNAVNKTDQEACRWVMKSALIQLQSKAKSLDVSKVSNIQSYYKKKVYNSTTQYECHAGRTIAGVALKADFIK
ncbi:excinuclease ABC subunit A [Testudinibacter sp. TR-2022]|uniref:excinuclease ABC subunit A n=1 Tax=Testudinibacter sp. TR-2022 TaxID=2585029 RepID=UPI00111A8FF7|nr:excinuclease ABC subunit A [Testudinibacter sp. TR-2022]TNH06007.1 excinuclease ABC subunit A [Pasteurellaceae bacterium Phil11]TNH24292.1 excinuclease ABC subunit A [Testudinibacter sp. TR-2022]TNH26883.1 excinuclease ABC subunit A [Testudinibacter sp. TR-2022]